MRHLLNTLFITSEDIYLSLEGENVVAYREKQLVQRFPLHILSGIITFSNAGASPALVGACAERGIALSFCTPRGRFLAQVTGENNGNVLLRRTQYRVVDDPAQSCRVARSMIFGKVYNSRQCLQRTLSDHSLRVDAGQLARVSAQLKEMLPHLLEQTDPDSLLCYDCSSALDAVGMDSYVGFLHRDRPGRSSLALDLMEELRPVFADRFV